MKIPGRKIKFDEDALIRDETFEINELQQIWRALKKAQRELRKGKNLTFVDATLFTVAESIKKVYDHIMLDENTVMHMKLQ